MSFTSAGPPASPWPFGDPVATALLGLLEVELRGHGLRFSTRGQRPARVDLGADCIGMVNQKKLQ